jgi:RsiW-degrading membrane proteinase PrsW (M82 family)
MTLVGRHSGERADSSTDSATSTSYVAHHPPNRTTMVLALGLTATLVAWGVLVYAAIDFGGQARSGESTAWLLLGLATVGAAACLFVTLLVGARLLTLAQGKEHSPPRPRGGRRAAR